MNRNKKITELTLVLIFVAALSGCNSVSVQHDHGYYSGYYYGPPPHAPAHGYRHHYHGHDLVYNRYLGVYIVLGEVNHYYHNGHYYRYDDHHKHWYHRSGSNKSWNKYDHRYQLPSGLANRHKDNNYKRDHGNRTVTGDYSKQVNRHKESSQSVIHDINKRNEYNGTVSDRDRETRNGHSKGHLDPSRDQAGFTQKNKRRNSSEAQQGITKNNQGNKNTSTRVNKLEHGSDVRNKKNQDNVKSSNHRAVVEYANVDRGNHGKKDKVQGRNNEGSSREGRREKVSNNLEEKDHYSPGKSNLKRQNRIKSIGTGKNSRGQLRR